MLIRALEAIPVRSPLLGNLELISFPRGTQMFQFPGSPRQHHIDSVNDSVTSHALGFPQLEDIAGYNGSISPYRRHRED